MSPEAFHLDGLRMNAPVTAPGGVINKDTIFEFTQTGPVAEALRSAISGFAFLNQSNTGLPPRSS